jgi:hypothetical protein
LLLLPPQHTGDAVSSGELLLLLLDTSLLRSAATYGLQVDLFLQQVRLCGGLHDDGGAWGLHHHTSH